MKLRNVIKVKDWTHEEIMFALKRLEGVDTILMNKEMAIEQLPIKIEELIFKNMQLIEQLITLQEKEK